MGQKTHPHGLRLGIFRKWNNSWYASEKENKDLFFFSKKAEDFFKSILNIYSYTKISQTKKALVVDLKLFKYNNRNLFIFVYFYKFKSKKRKENTFSKLKNTNKKYQWHTE